MSVYRFLSINYFKIKVELSSVYQTPVYIRHPEIVLTVYPGFQEATNTEGPGTVGHVLVCKLPFI